MILALVVLAASPPALDGLDWRALPAGEMMMGAEDGDPDEQPRKKVKIAAFEMSRSEVTVSQYDSCVIAGACKAPRSDHAWCTWDRRRKQPRLPVNCLSWRQAQVFARWAGAALPTEAQWEYAARGAGKDIAYPWGEAKPSCAHTVMKGCHSLPQPVCSKPKGHTAQGLCDMAGNVWEWTADHYEPGYGSLKADGSARTTKTGKRVRRGGCFNSEAHHLRNRNRAYYPKLKRYPLGFRLVRKRP